MHETNLIYVHLYMYVCVCVSTLNCRLCFKGINIYFKHFIPIIICACIPRKHIIKKRILKKKKTYKV